MNFARWMSDVRDVCVCVCIFCPCRVLISTHSRNVVVWPMSASVVVCIQFQIAFQKRSTMTCVSELAVTMFEIAKISTSKSNGDVPSSLSRQSRNFDKWIWIYGSHSACTSNNENLEDTSQTQIETGQECFGMQFCGRLKCDDNIGAILLHFWLSL